MSYAQNTEVSVEKSKQEIERLVSKYGAKSFVYGWDDDGNRAVVQFDASDRRVRFVIPVPRITDREITHTPKGRVRSRPQAQKEHQQAQRRSWRALVLIIKAKLEAVESNVTTFEEEFLAHIVLPDGQTVGEWVQPQLESAYSGEGMPEPLPQLPSSRPQLTSGSS